MKTFFKVAGYTVVTMLIAGGILITSLSMQSSNKEEVGQYYGEAQGVVVVPAKQSHFFVTEDYKKALKCLKKGYVLQEVEVIVLPSDNKHKLYTMVKYAR